MSRNGLFSRPSQHDQAEVILDVEPGYDVDGEVEGLKGQVGKLKQVILCVCFLVSTSGCTGLDDCFMLLASLCW